MSTLNNFVIQHDESGMARFAFLMQALTDEVIEELNEQDEPTIRLFMEHMGEVIAWIGHGDNSRLPDSLLPFADTLREGSISPNGNDASGDRRSELSEDHGAVA